MSNGTSTHNALIPHVELMRSIELFATRVLARGFQSPT
jgi:hypothetical protein